MRLSIWCARVVSGERLQKLMARLIGICLCCCTGSLQLAVAVVAADIPLGKSTTSGDNEPEKFPAALESTLDIPRDAALADDELNPLPSSLQRVIGILVEQNGAEQKVVRVGVASSAASAGLIEGDEIVHTELHRDVLSIALKRKGLPYVANIKLSSSILPERNQSSPTTAHSYAGAKNGARPFELKAEQLGSSSASNNRIPRPANASQDNSQPYNISAVNNQLNSSANRLINPGNFNSGTAQFDHNRPFDLNANTVAMQAQNHGFPVVDINSRNHGMPIVDINSPIRILANYQLELIVDQSLSMRKRDCPGGLSRWEWCGMQAEGLSRSISAFVPEGLTITPFSTNYRVYKQSSAQNVVDLFQRGGLSFGTRLAEPLGDRLNSFFKNRQRNNKPLLIAVITDGIPFPQPEPQMVINELVKATHKMSNPFEVTVVFFQIGGKDRFGHNYLQYLDTSLFRDGARFHLVHTVPFEQLQQSGLANALVQTLQDYGQNR